MNIIPEKDKPSMDWSTRMKIALGSAKGFEYLHVYCEFTVNK